MGIDIIIVNVLDRYEMNNCDFLKDEARENTKTSPLGGGGK